MEGPSFQRSATPVPSPMRARQRPRPPDPRPLFDNVSFGVAARASVKGEGSRSGGDFTDVVVLPDGRWLVIVGDIEGKGAVVARDAEWAKDLLHTAGTDGDWPHQMVSLLNAARHPSDADVDAPACAVSVLSLRAHKDGFAGRACSAGNPLPLIIKADGHIQTVGGPGMAAGWFADSSWTDWTFTLHAGDTLIAFTDGLTDARSDDFLFGEGPLQAEIRNLAQRFAGDAPHIAKALVDSACSFGQLSTKHDDIAVAVLAVAPAARAEQR
jgi:phosphoserine phosphatase RsbU/P